MKTMTLRDRSGVIALRYITEEWDRHGNIRVYFRKRGKRIRIREQWGSQEFMAEYRRLLISQTPKEQATSNQRDTLRWLIQQYYASPKFKALVKHENVRRILDSISLAHGHRLYIEMEPRDVRIIRDEKSGFPTAANSRVINLRLLFKWAMQYDHTTINPAIGVEYLKVTGDGFHTWTVDEVFQFQDKYPLGTKPRLALDILLLAGVRRSDAVRLGKQMERDGRLHFTEYKGHTRKIKNRSIMILPSLRASLDACPSGHLTYLVTDFGKPFTSQGFGNWFRKQCDEAGLPHCSAHGLRKAGATIAAEAGATEHELMAMFGWESPMQAAIYTRKANREKLTDGAIHLVEPERKSNATVSLFRKSRRTKP